MHYRSDKKNNKNISINESVGFDKDGNEITFLDILKTPKPDFALDLHKQNNLNLTNYQDAGSMLFKEENFENSGSSGPVTLPLVLFNKIIQSKKYKNILIIATGALHSTTLVNQHEEIPAIAHAVALEVL